MNNYIDKASDYLSSIFYFYLSQNWMIFHRNLLLYSLTIMSLKEEILSINFWFVSDYFVDRQIF